MIKNLSELAGLIRELGYFVFMEEGSTQMYIGICVDDGKDADIYVYEDGATNYINNEVCSHNIFNEKGVVSLANVMAFVNSYQNYINTNLVK